MSKKKVPLWLPYLQKMELTTNKSKITFKYNGGEVVSSLEDILSIMLYGDSEPVDLNVIEALGRKGIPIVIHRRNLANSIWIHSGVRSDVKDILTKQILARENKIKSMHIVRKILLAKLKSMTWLINIKSNPLPKGMGLVQMRAVEAYYSRVYWNKFFLSLGYEEFSRRKDNPCKELLDAASKFISSIILRWVCYHHLSPFHGFLHEPTDYPALVYDFIEPYRPIFERTLHEYIRENKLLINQKEKFIAGGIDEIKERLDDKVYVDLTRQIVTYHELLHGVCLAFRAYLLREASQFMVPLPSIPNGGRPRKAGFKMYGRTAGKTDFWKEARFYSSKGTLKLTDYVKS